jgi:pyridoxal 5'-phosphate synthase pdxT subunit
MHIGILALQGDFQKHGEHLRRLGCEPLYVRNPDDLAKIEGLIIPGGESTTIGKLILDFGLNFPLEERISEGMPLFGTCAGLILMAREIEGPYRYKLNVLDVTVERNAYGRQTESFESRMQSDLFGEMELEGVFIRAPRIIRSGPAVDVLASFEDDPVLVREGMNLAASFHPELTENLEIHSYFLDMVKSHQEKRS